MEEPTLFDNERINENNYNDLIHDSKGNNIKALFIKHLGKRHLLFYSNDSLVVTNNDKLIIVFMGISTFISKFS